MHNQHWLTSTKFSLLRAHRGRIKLVRGHVSKSSAALNPLTITQLACDRPRGRSRTALRGPAHQLAGAHAKLWYVARYGTVCGTLPLGNSSLLLRCIDLLCGGFCTLSLCGKQVWYVVCMLMYKYIFFNQVTHCYIIIHLPIPPLLPSQETEATAEPAAG